MFRPQRAGRRISMLLAVVLLGLGGVWGGVAVASTIGGGGGGGIDPGGDPGGAGTIPAGTVPPITPPVVTGPGGGLGGGGGVIIPDADVSVTKAAAPDPVAPGGNITYTISVTDAQYDQASGITLTDPLGTPTTFVSLTQNSGPGFSCATPAVGAAGTVTCTLGSLDVGVSASFTLVVNVPAATSTGTTITNTASVDASATIDPNPANNSASASTIVATPPPPVADLSVTKSDGPDPATAGNNIVYTITAANAGPASAASVSLTDAVPANTTFFSLNAPAGWTTTTPPVGGTGNVTATTGSLASGASATFSLVVHVDASVANSTTITNSAAVTSATSDPNAANNTATATTTVTTEADLGVSKMAPATATDGTNITYAIPVTNNGPSSAPNVSVTDVVPANTTFVSATPAAGSCSGTTTVTCNVGTVAPGATVNISLAVKLGSTTPGGTVITNTASATSPATDPNSANNSASATTTAVAALQSISVAPANKTLAPGMTQQYTATGNYSDASAQDLTGTANWSSTAPGIAGVNTTGLAQATAPGTTTVAASVGAVSGNQSLKVSPLRLITVRPLLSILRPGATRSLTATGRFANGVTATLNDQVRWSSTNAGVAGVSPQALVTSSSPGVTIIVARFGNTFSIPALVLVL